MFVDRRAFLRSLGGALRDSDEAPPPAALPAARRVTANELVELAARCGLGSRLDDVRSLARTSVRLTPARGRTGSYLGGTAELALDLEAVARVAGTGHGLPARGVLWCLRAGEDVRVLVRDGPARGHIPLDLSAEVVLPRVWAAPAQALALSPQEAAGWEELRAALAAAQGVEPPQATPDHVLGVLGYPEDRRGDMPLGCELRSRGHEAEPAGCEAASARWQLLLQLPAGPAARLFVWVPGAGELGRALAVVR